MNGRAIRVENVAKSFSRATGRKLLRSHLSTWFGPSPHEPFYALRDVSFSIGHSESVAILGSNGAGKSTLLSLIAGLAEPDQGLLR
jgi:ABC-2 type transport system ATP-binding protein